MRTTTLLIYVFFSFLPLVSTASDNHSPYAGQQHREIKSLSASEIEGYLQGKGMGFAKPAELNHYPGPLHVLELESEIKLDKKQLEATQELYEKMKARAMIIGKELVHEEQQLDKLFASGQVNDESLKQQINRIAKLRGELRFTHLATHLEQKKILTRHQVMKYDQLRGYGKPGGHGAGHNHQH